jgi:hypothetical protein
LINLFQEFYGTESPAGMSLSEFCLTLVQLLSSTRTSDDLQAELFDLIGFEKIELIQLILLHRSEIVDSKTRNKNAMKREIAMAAASNYLSSLKTSFIS